MTVPFVVLACLLLISFFGTPWYVAVALTVVASVTGMALQPVRMRKILDRPAYEGGFAERKIEITPDAYIFEDENDIASSIPLDQFLSVRLLLGHYVMTLLPNQSFLIPQDAFETEVDEMRFRDYVRGRVPKVIGF